MSLYPTPTRLALLRDIADRPGKVYTCRDFDDGEWRSYWRKLDHSERMVTANCRQMQREGWIETGPAATPSMYARRPWRLTDAGREVLREAGEKP